MAMTRLFARVSLILCAIALAFGASGAVLAKSGPAVSSKMVAFVVTRDDEGAEKFRPAQRVNPGAVIEYRISHRNRSGDGLKGLVVQGPIPRGTAYISQTARTDAKARFEVLIAGEQWQGLPAYKTVTMDDGAKKRIRATAADYRAIRWRLQKVIADGQATHNAYRVRVLK